MSTFNGKALEWSDMFINTFYINQTNLTNNGGSLMFTVLKCIKDLYKTYILHTYNYLCNKVYDMITQITNLLYTMLCHSYKVLTTLTYLTILININTLNEIEIDHLVLYLKKNSQKNI